MNGDFTILIEQMKIIASLMLIGFAEYKIKLFNDNLVKSLSAIISKLILPLMLATMIGSISNTELLSGVRILVATLIIYGCSVLITYKIRKLYPVNDDEKKMHSLLQCYGNTGYIGVPLLASIFPQASGIVSAAFILIDACFYWVVGPAVLSGGKISFKKLISPITLSILIGFIVCISGINLNNNILWITAKEVGSTCKYFASIYIGMIIASMSFANIKNSLFAIISIPVKLFVIPLAAYLLFGKTGFLSGDILTMFIILCATPAGMSLPVVADIAESNSGNYASAGIMVSTILCLFTIPLVVYIISII